MSQSEGMLAAELVAWAIEAFHDRFAIAVSFQKEGMVLLDMAWRICPTVPVFTLETGRLPEATHRMIDTVLARYGTVVEQVRPDAAEVAQMVANHGPNLFRDSAEFRRLCCEIRKVRPLERRLQGLEAWATGLRREHSADRAGIPKLEQQHSRIKLNPLADWTTAQVDQYIFDHDVPVHPLYAHGFASIGCEPCTRALLPGETGRDGRWWWEKDARKECGIHFTADGAVRRAALIPAISADSDA